MGIGKKIGNQSGNLREELKKAKQTYKEQELKAAQLEQLTYLNKTLLQQLKATEKSHSSLMKYITEMHKNLGDNFHRTAIEEIWYKELGKYIRQFK